MAYNASLPPDNGSLVSADIRENFRALKEDDIVDGITRSIVAGTGLDGGGQLNANRTLNHTAHTGDVTGSTALTIGAAKVAQSMLKTSTLSVSILDGSGVSTFTLNQEYSFNPRGRVVNTSGVARSSTVSWDIHYGESGYTEYAATSDTGYRNWLSMGSDYNEIDVYFQCRYVTASGEVHWIFILRNKKTKKIIAMWQAPDHPCFGNGGKPLLTPHPFGNYDESKYEIIVINPSLKEIEQMESETIVEDETKPDKDLLQIIAENYEIDEDSSPVWPAKEVTVGLPKYVKDKKTGKKVLADYRFMPPGTAINPIKKAIPQPEYIKVKKLRRK